MAGFWSARMHCLCVSGPRLPEDGDLYRLNRTISPVKRLPHFS